MRIPRSSSTRRRKPASAETAASVFSLGEITSSTGCWRRSARSAAALIRARIESEAERSRSESSPAATEGNVSPASNAISVTTTIISMSVTPRFPRRPLLIAPTDDIGIIPLPAGLAVGAQREDVRLIAVLARILIKIGAAPGIQRNILGQIRTRPLRLIVRFDAQRVQALIRGRIGPGIQLVGAQRRHERLDLRPRLRPLGLVGLAHHARRYQRRKQRDDGH